MGIWNPLQAIARNEGGRHIGLSALATCRGLINLVMQLQQHRGMSSAWLAGDRDFEVRMGQRRLEIERRIPELRPGFELESRELCSCFTGNDLRLFRFRWQELLERLPHFSVHENIESHNNLIGQLLGWLAAAGESRIELTAEDSLPPGLVRNFAVRLPELAECLGRARALGSSVAARGVCSPVPRVRLMFLVGRAETLLKQAADADPGGHGAGSARQQVEAMVTLVRSEILGSAGVRVDAGHYFDAASRTIDTVYAWIFHSGNALESGLGARGSRFGGLHVFG